MENNISITNFSLFPLVFAARKRKGQTVTSTPLSTQPSNELTSLIVRLSSCEAWMLIFPFHPANRLLFSWVLSFTCFFCLVLLLNPCQHVHRYFGKRSCSSPSKLRFRSVKTLLCQTPSRVRIFTKSDYVLTWRQGKQFLSCNVRACAVSMVLTWGYFLPWRRLLKYCCF